MVYTFYSYRGDSASTLANVGSAFYERGARVLIMDCCLESPGIESYFYRSHSDIESCVARPGVIELFSAYRRQYAAASRITTLPCKQDTFSVAVSQLPSLNSWMHPICGPHTVTDGRPGPALWLIPAGRRCDFPTFAAAAQGFKWRDFYDNYEGERFFRWLLNSLTRPSAPSSFTCDVALLNVSGGLTEVALCAQDMADVVVAVTPPNIYQLSELERILLEFRRPEILAARDGKPDIIIVPSGVDTNELASMDAFEERLRQSEDAFRPSGLYEAGISYWDLRLPHIPRFVYQDGVAFRHIGRGDTYIHATDFSSAVHDIVDTLSLLLPVGHPLKGYHSHDRATSRLEWHK
jgi:hypothetical protein